MTEQQAGVINGALAAETHTLHGHMSARVHVLHGHISVETHTLRGRMLAEVHVLRGHMSAGAHVLCGRMASSTYNLRGHVQIPVSASPYPGECVATPSNTTQVFSTAGHIMPNNFVVNPIPSNYGLITYNGYDITVS